MSETEVKYAKKIEKDAKMFALDSIIPETLRDEAGVFWGR